MTYWARRSFVGCIFFLLYFPIGVLVVYSVNAAKYSLQWKGFSLNWYKELLTDNGLWGAFCNSMILGLSASFIATLIGLLTCVHLFIVRSRKRPLLQPLLLVLIIIPDLVIGVAQLLFFNACNIPLGFSSLLIAHTTFCFPFTLLTINSRINTLDPNLYFSAVDLGASHWMAIHKILLPLLWPAVLSAFLLCFTLSFDDVVISYFISGADFNILPLTIYSLVRSGVTPEINALCTITLLFSMLMVIGSYRVSSKPL